MTAQGALLLATICFPLLLLAACFVDARVRGAGRLLLPIAPLPGLIAAIALPDGIGAKLPDVLLGLTFELDRPGRLLLGTAALLWIAGGICAGAYRRKNQNDDSFTVWWLATLTGSLGVFITADLVGFYLFFTIVSLAAYWLVVEEGTPSVRRAGTVYVSFALLSEAFLLMAFVLLAVAGDSLQIRDAVATISDSPLLGPVLTLVILGFGVKIGMVPLHVWMPPTYTSAPIPVAAVLSGAAVKAGVIGLIRFLPFDAPLPGCGEILAALGAFSAFYGAIVGLTQSNPKTILAYSSISQMGVITMTLGLGLATGEEGVAVLAAFYALHHVLVKGGLFLGLGALEQGGARGPWPVLVPAGIIALGLGGLPLTGGAIAKLAIKPPLGDGLFSQLGMLSAAASTLLMLHFLRRVMAEVPDGGPTANRALLGPWLAIALAAVILPWALYASVTGKPVSEAWSAKVLWDALWPVLVGAALAGLMVRWPVRWPPIPPGDVLAFSGTIVRAGSDIGRAMQVADDSLRRWPVAGVALLLIATALIAVAR